jgi:AcrR family transcriptional regulator
MVADLPILPIAEPASGALTERADAARNRKRILEATAALVAERGIEHVSMQDVAEAACVGTGTLYRRFGDRAGLALALLDEQTRALQDALIAGPPTLGPGAPPAERLEAFGLAYLDLLEQQAEVIAVGSPAGREGDGPLQLYLTHVAMLIREAAPDADAEYLAGVLLGALGPREHLRARKRLGWPLDRLEEGWRSLVAGVLRG